ncbi:Glu-tRNA(Gln) amidotransferase GatDE subunit D [Candidatus Woesearchaeota archaeon]|nr:Glu-tRNA(Gln) amidotransferase subunit GatD [Candidatus Woesearchaeota archaeon]RLE41158.1 MAG: Glu-tRNA(Gln) amidotransferase GatDE subunit D [Candidatus Woesearchaeota archaeon]
MSRKKVEAGDEVEIILKDGTRYKGILMPRPALYKDDHVVLKLPNGYNIGIEKKKVKEIKLVKKYEEKKAKKEKTKKNPSLPNVLLISCGGTISSRVDYRTGGVYADYTAEDFVAMCPELAEIANIDAKQLMQIMSEDMNHEEWIKIAEAVFDALQRYDGVVVTQGTDTLHYTTAALSFFLRNIGKPVIVTGAQRSIDRPSSDAFMNLICSVIAAKSDLAGVYCCMHGTINDDFCYLLRGTKVRKMHTSRRDAFRPINDLPMAKIFPSGKLELIQSCPKRTNNIGKLEAFFEPKVALVYVYPGMDPEIISFYRKKKFKGLVLAATALGHVPTSKKRYSLIPELKKAIADGMIVVIASQTLYGRVHPYVYTNLRKLSMELGCVFASDMLPEAAYIKLGWLLGKYRDKEKIKELMQYNFAGEINDRHLPDMFLF